MTNELNAYADRPWGDRGDSFCWLATLRNERTGARKTWYCNSREAAESKIQSWCGGQFGNVATLTNEDDTSFAPVTYAWSIDRQRAIAA